MAQKQKTNQQENHTLTDEQSLKQGKKKLIIQ